MLLSHFAGMHFSDFDRSGVSLVTLSLTTSAPMLRGARPARPFTHFSYSFLLFFAPPASCLFFIDVGRPGASLASISLTTSAPMLRGARPARSFTHFSNSFLLLFAPPASCRLAGWLVGWLAGWSAGWLLSLIHISEPTRPY